MFGKFVCAAPRDPAPHPEKSPDKSKPSALAQPNPPNPRAEQPAPHATENPVNNCTPCPQKANSEIAASTLAPHPSAAPNPTASDRSRQRQIPTDKESNPRKAPESPDPTCYSRTAPDQAGTAQY